MPSSNAAQFRSVRRGYDPAQVDHHMNELTQTSSALWHEAAERTVQITDLKAANDRLKSEVERQVELARTLEEAQKEAAEPTYAGLGERIGTILTLVDQEARELQTRAQANSANQHALAEESALATRQDADDYARHTRAATDDDVSRLLEDTRQHAENLLSEARLQSEILLDDAKKQAGTLQDDAERQAMARQDADRQEMASREEAEAVYERARAKTAAAAVDFETTLAARRDKAVSDFAAQVAAAEQQLASVRLRTEQTRHDSEQAQQEAASKSALQLEQSTAHSQSLVGEAKTKAERIRADSERELLAATKRRDGINAQLSNVRRDLAALGDVARHDPSDPDDGAKDPGAEDPDETGDKQKPGSRVAGERSVIS